MVAGQEWLPLTGTCPSAHRQTRSVPICAPAACFDLAREDGLQSTGRCRPGTRYTRYEARKEPLAIGVSGSMAWGTDQGVVTVVMEGVEDGSRYRRAHELPARTIVALRLGGGSAPPVGWPEASTWDN